MTPILYTRFLDFLREDLAIAPDAIAIAQRYFEKHPSSFPMLLWQYGLVTLEQLDHIFDWLEGQEINN